MRAKGKEETDFEEGGRLRCRPRFRVRTYITYLKFVLAALGPEGVGAADEQQLLGRQRRDDSNVILALVLKREREKRGSVSTIFFAKGGGDAAVRSVVYGFTPRSEF